MRGKMYRLAALAEAMLMAFTAFPAMAATKKIQSINIKFTIEGYDDYGTPEITASTSSELYSVGSVDLESSYEEDDDDDTVSKSDITDNTYVVEASAEDGYLFYVTKASQVHLSGGGATYVKASRTDGGSTLRITVKFSKLETVCGQTANVSWGENGRLSWDAAINAKQYKLIIYNQDKKGAGKTVYTGYTTYDFRPLMTSAGSYYVKVKPMAEGDYVAEGTDSDTLTVNAEQAAQYKAAYGVQTEMVTSGDGTGPTSMSIKYLNTGWKEDNSGWWYQNNDGSYIQYNWLQQGNDWYFFNSEGYMAANAVIQWGKNYYYVGNDGKMVMNADIPDGRKAGADGILIGTATKSDTVVSIGNGSEEASSVGPTIDPEKAKKGLGYFAQE